MEAPADALETTEATVWIDGGIIFAQGRGRRATPESTAEVFDAFHDLAAGSPRPVLMDLSNWPGATPESWQIGVENVEAAFAAIAMLIDREPDSDIRAFSSAIDRMLVPCQLFSDEAEALEFLQAYIHPQTSE